MKLRRIAHRGNREGPNPDRENEPGYVMEAINMGLDVEVDVWWIMEEVWLGHDKPQYKVDGNFIKHQKLWCHAKNIQAMAYMMQNSNIHCFFHQTDDIALTSMGYLWTYPGKTPLTYASVAVMPETKPGWVHSGCFGICSDWAASWEFDYEKREINGD